MTLGTCLHIGCDKKDKKKKKNEGGKGVECAV